MQVCIVFHLRLSGLLALGPTGFLCAGIAEVMSLVTGLGGDEAAGRQEVSGPTDPLRVVVSHTLQPAARSVSFTVELLNRLTADIKGLVLRSASQFSMHSSSQMQRKTPDTHSALSVNGMTFLLFRCQQQRLC